MAARLIPAQHTVNGGAARCVMKGRWFSPAAMRRRFDAWSTDSPAARAAAVNQVDYQASFWFPVTPPQLWAIIERFDLYESWWVWLAGFTADDDGLVDGNVLYGTVIPPVPYRLRLAVQLQRCDRPRLVEAAIGGDLRGRASCSLRRRPAVRAPTWPGRCGCTARRCGLRHMSPTR
jgi:hypothetical protein